MQNKLQFLRKCLIYWVHLGTSVEHLQMGLFRKCSMSIWPIAQLTFQNLGGKKIVYMVKDSRIEKKIGKVK